MYQPGHLLSIGKGRPIECKHLTKSSVPSVSSTFWPILVMMRILATTYGESVTSIPILDRGEPTGPMLNGITYIVLPERCKITSNVEKNHRIYSFCYYKYFTQSCISNKCIELLERP